MNFSEITFDGKFLQWVVMTVVGVYSWLIGRQSASHNEVLELRTRITTIEANIAALPTQQQVTQLIEKLSHNEAALSGVSDRLTGLSQQLNNINQFLLKSK